MVNRPMRKGLMELMEFLRLQRLFYNETLFTLPDRADWPVAPKGMEVDWRISGTGTSALSPSRKAIEHEKS